MRSFLSSSWRQTAAQTQPFGAGPPVPMTATMRENLYPLPRCLSSSPRWWRSKRWARHLPNSLLSVLIVFDQTPDTVFAQGALLPRRISTTSSTSAANAAASSPPAPPPEEWQDLFGNPLLASAGLDRLTHDACVVIITGASFGGQGPHQSDKVARIELSDQP
jgi:hypothetical protein